MGVRVAIDEHRTLTVVIVAVLLIGVIALWGLSRGDGSNARQSWFTDDDGSTWFAADAGNLPPFEHNGKQAVGCVVVRCGKTPPRVAHLVRYTEEAKKALESGKSADAFSDPSSLQSRLRGLEVKLPGTGDKGWVRMDDPKARSIIELKCPEGSTDEVVQLDPNE